MSQNIRKGGALGNKDAVTLYSAWYKPRSTLLLHLACGLNALRWLRHTGGYLVKISF